MKIKNWKQSYGCQMDFSAMGPTIFELWVMETELWIMEIDDPNSLIVYSKFYFIFL